jgi:hypothetical protein
MILLSPTSLKKNGFTQDEGGKQLKKRQPIQQWKTTHLLLCYSVMLLNRLVEESRVLHLIVPTTTLNGRNFMQCY